MDMAPAPIAPIRFRTLVGTFTYYFLANRPTEQKQIIYIHIRGLLSYTAVDLNISCGSYGGMHRVGNIK